MRIRRIELVELRMRLLQPFETSFGVTENRRILIAKISDGNLTGYGEVTAGEGPFYCHETTDTAWHILRDFIIPRVVGKAIASATEFAPFVDAIRGHNMTKAGVETALWDLEAKIKGLPLWKLLGGSRAHTESGVSIGIQPSVDVLAQRIETALASGYRRIKIKIKPGWDLEVVREIRRAFPNIGLLGDANSAYTLADVPLFQKLDEFQLMMYEQPLHYEDMIDHAELQKQIRTPICLDESIHSAADARKAIAIGACRIVNIKLGRVGGYVQARAVHNVCRDRGVPVWCGGMLESGIGRAHNIAMSSLENFTLPGDIGASSRYWDEDIIDPPVEVSADGRIAERMDAGIGYEVKEGLIDRLTVRREVFSA